MLNTEPYALFNKNVEQMSCWYITDRTLTREEGRLALPLAPGLEYPSVCSFPLSPVFALS